VHRPESLDMSISADDDDGRTGSLYAGLPQLGSPALAFYCLRIPKSFPSSSGLWLRPIGHGERTISLILLS
jgi:hypothetical protein